MSNRFFKVLFLSFLACVFWSLNTYGQEIKAVPDFLKFDSLIISSPVRDESSTFLGINGNYIFYAKNNGLSSNIQLFKYNKNKLTDAGTFPVNFRASAAISTGNGIICFADQMLIAISFDSIARKLDSKPVVNIPFSGKPKSVSYSGHTLYAVQEVLTSAKLKVWSLEINGLTPGEKWKALPDFSSRSSNTVFVLQNNDTYKIDGQSLEKADLKKNSWIPVLNLPALTGVYTAYPVGPFHIAVIGKAVAKGEAPVYLYHTITKKWFKSTIHISGNWLPPVINKNELLIPSISSDGDLQLHSGIQKAKKTNMGGWDILSLAIYFVGLFFISYFFSKRKETTDEYFKGGKRVPWYASGISIVATKLSAVSFVSLPAKAFTSNWTYLLVPAGNIAIAWFVVRYVIPFFCRLDVTSAYEYLEKRFNVWVRTIASLNFLIFELVKIGVLFIVPAVVLNVTVGVNMFYSIALIGITTTIYTLIGGIEGVIWTEAAQVIVMIGGTIAAIVVISLRLDYSMPLLGSLINDGKLKTVDLTWDFSRSTLWVLILYWIGGLKNYISNQTIIQRYLTTRNEKQAAKGIWFANLLNIPIIWLFLLLGTALYLYYGQNPQKANPLMDQPDALLPWFIMLELPAGVAGLLIAGIFAASMSSLESSLNSMSTVMVADFYKRYTKNPDDLRAVRLGKLFVIILGLTGTIAGLILATQPIQSLYDKFFELIGLFGGGLGGLFLLGMMTEKANAKGTLIGFALSAVFQYYINNYTSLSFFTYLFMGMMSCFLFGYVFSLIFPTNQKNIDGLTIHTLNKINNGLS